MKLQNRAQEAPLFPYFGQKWPFFSIFWPNFAQKLPLFEFLLKWGASGTTQRAEKADFAELTEILAFLAKFSIFSDSGPKIWLKYGKKR